MELAANERIDFVNDNLSLIQKTDGLTFGTDALLLAAYIGGGYDVGVEFGGGTGIISMLLGYRGKAKKLYCVEVQEEYADLIERNLRLNGIENVKAVPGDVREYRTGEVVDLVFSNPPYMKTSSGYANGVNKKNQARHEVNGTIADFTVAAARVLKWGGDCYFVYRPDRLIDLVCAMREAGIEPKRMTMVSADKGSAPSLVLVMGKRGGKPDLTLTEPLYMYADSEHRINSPEVDYILENGRFPDRFYIK